MNDDNGILGEIIEKAGTAVKQTGKVAANAVGGATKQAASQVGVPVADTSGNVPQDASTQDMVESFYGKSQPQNQNPNPQPAPQQGLAPNVSDKTPQEQAELEVVRKRLHDEYYQSLVNPPKQEEERAAEKVEREEKEEMVDLQQKKMEKPPELVQRAAQRVEKFPGASG